MLYSYFDIAIQQPSFPCTYTQLPVLSACTANSNSGPVIASRVGSCEITGYYWFSARYNGWSLAIFQLISTFGQPKSSLVGQIYYTFSIGQHQWSIKHPIFKKWLNSSWSLSSYHCDDSSYKSYTVRYILKKKAQISWKNGVVASWLLATSLETILQWAL